MDNASKNAKDMINSLQMQYNRGRQAAITNELVDIITGALIAFRLGTKLILSMPRCQCSVRVIWGGEYLIDACGAVRAMKYARNQIEVVN